MIKTILVGLSILALHIVLVYVQILPGRLNLMLNLDLALAAIFVSGFMISYTGLKLGGETFNLRFLLTTTLQMLLMLGLIVVLAFNKIEGVKVAGFTSIILFVILLALQSVVLIKAVNKK